MKQIFNFLFYLTVPFLFSGCIAGNFVYAAIKHTNTKIRTDAITMQIASDKQSVTMEIDKTISRYHLLIPNTVKKKHFKYTLPLTHPPRHAELVKFQVIFYDHYSDRPKVLGLPPNFMDMMSMDEQGDKENHSIEFYDNIRLRSKWEKKNNPKCTNSMWVSKNCTSFLQKPILGQVSNEVCNFVFLIPYKLEEDYLYCYLPDIDTDINKAMHKQEETRINVPCTIGASIIAVPLLACDIILLPIEIPCAIVGGLIASAMSP